MGCYIGTAKRGLVGSASPVPPDCTKCTNSPQSVYQLMLFDMALYLCPLKVKQITEIKKTGVVQRKTHSQLYSPNWWHKYRKHLTNQKSIEHNHDIRTANTVVTDYTHLQPRDIKKFQTGCILLRISFLCRSNHTLLSTSYILFFLPFAVNEVM